ncbi:hypothetical protein F5Y15DRAFT_250081 [Xylariaceae sp. FL0016]|nr:hypothetical protein F5Y15DRAFT_250081 [Xylariaceae sp. FL0016]
MPPHLHPRSRMTSSLFATTLVASFLVVGLPHILPCPAPHVAYADSVTLGPEGTPQRQRRRRRQQQSPVPCSQDPESTPAAQPVPRSEVRVTDGMAQFPSSSSSSPSSTGSTGSGSISGGASGTEGEGDAIPVPALRRRERECPVPKPGGVIGELMGFKSSQASGDETRSSKGTTARTTPRGTDDEGGGSGSSGRV